MAFLFCAGVNDAAKQRVLHIAAAALEEAVQQPELEQARLGTSCGNCHLTARYCNS
jgi:hypothetical protein